MIRANDIHERVDWPLILAQLGIGETFLRRKRSGPCPACGGRDRYTFDNRHGRGDYICRGCGAGDGFRLLERVHGWSFSETRQRVLEAAGMVENNPAPVAPAAPAPMIATVPDRVMRLRRDRCAVADCSDAVAYLSSRGLWPLPDGCTLRAHATADYWHEGKPLGRYPAILADVVDVAGELVTVHATYLEGGAKLEAQSPRKLLSPLTGRAGCAARLVPVSGDTLGIAEGLETALASQKLHSVPTWAAVNAGLLAKFDPPAGIERLIVFADRDVAGLEAAVRLVERLQGKVRVEARIPQAPFKDWNDALLSAARSWPPQEAQERRSLPPPLG